MTEQSRDRARDRTEKRGQDTGGHREGRGQRKNRGQTKPPIRAHPKSSPQPLSELGRGVPAKAGGALRGPQPWDMVGAGQAWDAPGHEGQRGPQNFGGETQGAPPIWGRKGAPKPGLGTGGTFKPSEGEWAGSPVRGAPNSGGVGKSPSWGGERSRGTPKHGGCHQRGPRSRAWGQRRPPLSSGGGERTPEPSEVTTGGPQILWGGR